MKGNSSASILLKRIISVLSSIAKGQSVTIKSKTDAVKARLIMSFSSLKNKKLPAVGAISHKIHAILGGGGGGGQQHDLHVQGQSCKASGAIVLHNANESISHDYEAPHEEEVVVLDYYNYEDGDNKYPDLRHSLFEEFDHDQEEEFNELLGGDPNASVIDLIRNSKEEEGQNFSLEDEIDHVADLFIMKVHKRMRMQKLESFKRYQDMLHRSSA